MFTRILSIEELLHRNNEKIILILRDELKSIKEDIKALKDKDLQKENDALKKELNELKDKTKKIDTFYAIHNGIIVSEK